MAESKFVNRHQAAVQRKWISGRDLLTLLALFFGTIIAVALPPSLLIRLCRATANVLPLGFYRLATDKQVASALETSESDARTIMRDTLAARLISIFTFLRARILGPHFKTNLTGKEHLDVALKKGNGAVLWIADLVSAGDVSKICLAGQGYTVSHLSRPEHGFSDTRFGLKILNPIRQKFELRYLRERIVYYRENPQQAGNLMRQRLRENGIVSIFANGYEGRALVEADFLTGRFRLTGGAPRLAFKENSPVLPVFVQPAADAMSYEVVIGEPLKMTHADKNEAILEATTDFLARLSPIIKSRPGLWRGWTWFLLREKVAELDNESVPGATPQPGTAHAQTV